VEAFVAFVQGEYENKYGKTPEVYVTSIEDGAKVVA
jgi:galactokinase